MSHSLLTGVALGIAAIPAIYYLIVLYSAVRYFRAAAKRMAELPPDFTPPVSNVKPIRGLDPDAYENFASLCRQDYPDYEILFCTRAPNDPGLELARQVAARHPHIPAKFLSTNGYLAS